MNSKSSKIKPKSFSEICGDMVNTMTKKIYDESEIGGSTEFLGLEAQLKTSLILPTVIGTPSTKDDMLDALRYTVSKNTIPISIQVERNAQEKQKEFQDALNQL